MKSILIKGGHVIDPVNHVDDVLDVLIEDGKIAEIAKSIQKKADETIDASGAYVSPGFIDLHCHLREPGFEYKETIESGLKAAAKGGFTAVCCMANTKPANDDPAVTRYIIEQGEKAKAARVYPMGAASHGLEGKELTEYGRLKEAGCVALSDDGLPIRDSGFMRLACEYAKNFDMVLCLHEEDKALSEGGLMNESAMSTLLGLTGIPTISEETMIARDILIAGYLGARIHIQHVSTKGAVALVREAKKQGIRITAETCPHYIAGDDSLVDGYNTATKVSPPLRTKEDQAAVIEGLRDGTLDCIATDHAPHHYDEKRQEYQLAPNGISGFETALALCYTKLVGEKGFTVSELVEKMSAAPARTLSLPGGSLAVGETADITIFGERDYTIDVSQFISKGKNSPFDGFPVKAEVLQTIVGGDIVYGK